MEISNTLARRARTTPSTKRLPLSSSVPGVGIYSRSTSCSTVTLSLPHSSTSLSSKDGESSGGATLERRLPSHRGGARHPAWHHKGDRPHRDAPRSVRDGRDSLRAEGAFLRTELWSVGLHLLFHQEIQSISSIHPAR